MIFVCQYMPETPVFRGSDGRPPWPRFDRQFDTLDEFDHKTLPEGEWIVLSTDGRNIPALLEAVAEALPQLDKATAETVGKLLTALTADSKKGIGRWFEIVDWIKVGPPAPPKISKVKSY